MLQAVCDNQQHGCLRCSGKWQAIFARADYIVAYCGLIVKRFDAKKEPSPCYFLLASLALYDVCVKLPKSHGIKNATKITHKLAWSMP